MNPHREPFDPLSVSGKKRFPFTLACPSFVYRAGYAENARHLAQTVDEIELLFFESRFADSLPTTALVGELEALGQSGEITYNVHLPTDIFPGHPDPDERRRAVTVLRRMIARLAPLAPSTFTLHLNRETDDADIGRWRAATMDSLQRVLADGIAGRLISIENTDDDLAPAAPVIEALDLSVCMDMGHLLVRQRSLGDFFERWRGRITIVHLHGVDGGHDHLPLDRLADRHMETVVRLLAEFGGVVSLEVFARQPLERSIARLIGQRQRFIADP